jgi:NADH dehydrogenase [ubiquinone] 1 alpha subcomplex assembly factor 1
MTTWLDRSLRARTSSLWITMVPSLRTASLIAGSLFLVQSAKVAAAGGEEKVRTELHLKFDGDPAEPSWEQENDDVMGGVSKGRADIRDGVLAFTGSLSLENNGGFAQIRIHNLRHDLSGKKGMKLRVMGDGRTYQFRLATDARHRGSRIAYHVEFRTEKDKWTEVGVKFADLKASHHGTALDGPPADLSKVEEMSFLLADKQEGAFALKVDWMMAE